jgi:hypothetical protein
MISERTQVRLGRRYGWLLAAVLLLAVGARIWWVWPEELEPGALLSSARLRGSDYRLLPKAGIETKALVKAALFAGYSPDRHFEFQDAIKAWPSRYVREDSRHHYVEYLGKFGRIQLHAAYDPESSIDHWFEFLPTNLGVDAFFVPDVAVFLDSARPRYTVYIPNARDQSYMTVRVAERRVQKVSWITWYGTSQDRVRHRPTLHAADGAPES